MKKISINKLLKCIGILCGAAMLLGLNSCSSEKDPESVVNLLPVQKKRSGDGIWSMADNKGNQNARRSYTCRPPWRTYRIS